MAAYRSLEHERAFRRWSLPAASEVESGVEDVTFRVYSPDETRQATLRPSHRPTTPRLGTELADGIAAATSSPTALLKWLGIGVAIGALVLTASVLLVFLTDDTRTHGVGATASLVQMVSPKPAPTVTTEASNDSQAGTDFELPDDTQPAATRTASKARKSAPKPRLAVRDVPF